MPTKSEVLKMKQTRGAILSVAKQIGLKNGLVTGGKTLYRSKVNAINTGVAFFSSYWETLAEREAIVCGAQRITFGEFRDRIFRLANGLSDLGVKSGDRVAELLPNCSQWFEVNLACAVSGRSMPMLNWHLKPQEITACVNRSEATALIFDPMYLDSIASIKDQLNTVKHFIVLGNEAPSGMIAYEDLIKKSSNKLTTGPFVMAPVPYSGGTTGTPKLLNTDEMAKVLGDDDSVRRGTSKDEITALALMQIGAFHWYKIGKCKDKVTHNIRSLIPGPLYHAGVQVAVLPFFLGGTVVPMPKFTPEEFLRLIQDERINWTFVAPTMLERVLALPDEIKSRYDLSSMVSVICAAAPCPPHVKKEINQLFRTQGSKDDVFMEYYGASETGIISVLVPIDYQENEKRYNSVGKIRTAECRIYDKEKGQWAETGKEGHVLIRSHMALGLQYKGEKSKTEEAFLQVDGLTWYDDGLIGYIDQDNFLYLTSRAKEMIISGGVNIFPNEIEHVIKKHPKIFDVAVIRAPDEDLGEIPAAVIQLKDGEMLGADEVLQFCKDEGLYGFKLPKIINFQMELPRQLSGKLIKRAIEEPYWEGIERLG